MGNKARKTGMICLFNRSTNRTTGFIGITPILLVFLLYIHPVHASHILIPMDNSQTNHLKAYGIAYWVLDNQVEIVWLLNYRGGSFVTKYYQKYENELIIRGVSIQHRVINMDL